MVDGGWAYVWGAYALALVALAGLTTIVAARAAHWAREARKLERK